jgi:hypothetical protein
MANDFWLAQVVRRSWTGSEIPDVTTPPASLAWTIIVVAAAALAARPRTLASHGDTRPEMSASPWLRFYGDVPATLDYPSATVYEELSATVWRLPTWRSTSSTRP